LISTLAITPNRFIPLNPAEALKRPMTIYLCNTVFAAHLALIISSADCYTNMGSIPLQIYVALAQIFHESLAVTTDMAIAILARRWGMSKKVRT
jgi:hypothetical protein